MTLGRRATRDEARPRPTGRSAFTASTLCPVLLLGIWWRGLTARGAIAGMAVGALTCGGAILTAPWVDAGMLAPLLAQPAAWTVPLATAVVVLVSRVDRARVPRGADRFLARLHIPEPADARTPTREGARRRRRAPRSLLERDQ